MNNSPIELLGAVIKTILDRRQQQNIPTSRFTLEGIMETVAKSTPEQLRNFLADSQAESENSPKQ